MANPLLGEYKIDLNGLSYDLKLSMSVIASYEDELNSDFMADAYAGIQAMVEAAQCKDQPAKYASILCRAVSRNKAAMLVYLAAKESNSQVELGEIHEAFLVDHALDDARFHPAIFTTLALFAIQGKKPKKKDNSKAG
jgi:hypothetical protein|tara:strand:+ start:3559 stop:3972 length:414 start_codon:yes stop_codon:yes gene_type:complete